MLEQELNIKTLDFNYIVSYVALIIFLLNRIKESKRCKSSIREFLTLQGMLNKMPVGTKMQVRGAEFETVINGLGKILGVDFFPKK